jgi:hypothetical protein
MYIENEHILDYIEDDIKTDDNITTIIRKIYNNLLRKGVVQQLDVDILNEWLLYFSTSDTPDIELVDDTAVQSSDEIHVQPVTEPYIPKQTIPKKFAWSKLGR